MNTHSYEVNKCELFKTHKDSIQSLSNENKSVTLKVNVVLSLHSNLL